MSDVPPLPVLLVEDDPDLAANIQDYLERQGWRVDYAPNGALAMHQLISGKHCAGIFDLRLPGIGGLELCERVRAQISPALPVLMLTAADTLDDRLRGFRAGADDYLVKPFALAELLARLQALVRRSSRLINNLGKTLRIADLKLCASTREVSRDHQPLMLTKMGFTILEKLMQHAPAIVPRADLEFHLWGDETPGSDALRTHIATLRAAIDPPDLPPLLLTHRGVGYQLLSSRRSAP